MNQTTDWDTEFEVNDLMRERHDEYVRAVLAEVWCGWEEECAVDAHPVEAEDRLRIVERMVRVEDRPEWMHPLDAVGVLTFLYPEDGLSPFLQLDYLDAQRTTVGLGSHGRRLWTARFLGIGASRVAEYDLERPHQDLSGPSYLYRYYDEHDVLLYVGITKDPDKRYREHVAQGARWVPYAHRRTVEEHGDRVSVLAAERAAIRDESPIFNRIGSRLPEDAADHYLTTRV